MARKRNRTNLIGAVVAFFIMLSTWALFYILDSDVAERWSIMEKAHATGGSKRTVTALREQYYVPENNTENYGGILGKIKKLRDRREALKRTREELAKVIGGTSKDNTDAATRVDHPYELVQIDGEEGDCQWNDDMIRAFLNYINVDQADPKNREKPSDSEAQRPCNPEAPYPQYKVLKTADQLPGLTQVPTRTGVTSKPLGTLADAAKADVKEYLEKGLVSGGRSLNIQEAFWRLEAEYFRLAAYRSFLTMHEKRLQTIQNTLLTEAEAVKSDQKETVRVINAQETSVSFNKHNLEAATNARVEEIKKNVDDLKKLYTVNSVEYQTQIQQLKNEIGDVKNAVRKVHVFNTVSLPIRSKGSVIYVDDQRTYVFLDKGKKSGIHDGMRFVIYAEGPQLLPDQLATVVVKEVYDDSCRAAIVNPRSYYPVTIGCYYDNPLYCPGEKVRVCLQGTPTNYTLPAFQALLKSYGAEETNDINNADIVVIGFIPADAEADATIRTPLLRKIAEGRVPVIYEKDFFNRVGR